MKLDQCPPKEQLSDFLFGRINLNLSEKVGCHVRHCSECQDTLQTCNQAPDTIVTVIQEGAHWQEIEHEPQLVAALAEIGRLHANSNPDRPPPNSRGKTNVDDRTTMDGVRLGQYRLLARLGEGGMGTVYKAEHTRLEMIVAVKVLADSLTHHPEAVARFDREMKAVGRVNHPNIIRATDAGEENGTHYLAMDFVDGLDLGAILASHGPLRICDACEVICQAAAGLQHVHGLGLIHRDLKPSNLMVTREGQTKVLDLGLARLQLPDSGEGLTNDFQVMGTADYMAPEQAARAKEVDSRADIYSLGCTLYALLCGKPPFSEPQHDSPLRKLMAHDVEQPTSPHLRRGDVPLALSAIVDKALSKSPDRRFSTAAEFAAAIRPYSIDADLSQLVASAIQPQTRRQASNETSRSLSMKRTTLSTAKPLPQPSSRFMGGSRWTRVMAAVVAVSLLGCGLWGAVQLRFQLTTGTIVVEIDGDQISAESEGAELIITDKTNNQSYRLTLHDRSGNRRLPPGEYSIKVAQQGSGIRLNTEKFQIMRRNQTVVTAYIAGSDDGRAAASDANRGSRNKAGPRGDAGSLDRYVIEWAFDKGATTTILVDEQFRQADKSTELPDEEFLLVACKFKRRVNLTDDEFSQLKGLSRLNNLEFQDLELTAHVVAKLAEFPLLSNLILQYNESAPLGLERLVRLRALTDLTIQGSLVGDSTVDALVALKSVPRMTIVGNQVTDRSLPSIARMKQLEFLSLLSTQVSGRGLNQLHHLPLWSLQLAYSPVTDEALADLAGFQQVTWLNLGGTQVTDEVLKQVSQMPRLDTLCVSQTTIQGTGLVHLRTMKGLRKLDLLETKITDADVDELAALTQLRELLVGNRLSAEAIKLLRIRLPMCSIQ